MFDTEEGPLFQPYLEMLRFVWQLGNFAGKRPKKFDEVGIPKGWVVSEYANPQFLEKSAPGVIPIAASYILGVFSTPASNELNRFSAYLSSSVYWVVVPDAEARTRYSWGPVDLMDLSYAPNYLWERARSLGASANGANLAGRMKRLAALIVDLRAECLAKATRDLTVWPR